MNTFKYVRFTEEEWAIVKRSMDHYQEQVLGYLATEELPDSEAEAEAVASAKQENIVMAFAQEAMKNAL